MSKMRIPHRWDKEKRMQNTTLLLGAKAILEQMGFEIAILERKDELFWPEREGYFHLTPKHMYDSDCLMAWNDHRQLELGVLGATLTVTIGEDEYPLNSGAEISELQKLAAPWLS